MDWLIGLLGIIGVAIFISIGIACITRKEVFLKVSLGGIVIFGIIAIITALVQCI